MNYGCVILPCIPSNCKVVVDISLGTMTIIGNYLFALDIKLLTMNIINLKWNSLPVEVRNSPTLRTFKTRF